MVSLLALFYMMILVFAAVMLAGGGYGDMKKERTTRSQVSASGDKGTASISYREDIFYCGEKSEYSRIEFKDIFWGLKFSFKHYFKLMKNAHNGK